MIKSIPKLIRIYIAWMAIAILCYPIAVAVPIIIHMITHNILITPENIRPFMYIYGYGERTVLYLVAYTALLGITQQLFLRYFLSIHIRYWAIGTFFGSALSIFILHTGQTPFGDSLNLAPWFFGFSAVQAILLFRYTSWAWLWIVAHLAIAGLFPLTMNNSLIDVILQWVIKAGIGGVVTVFVLQIIITKAQEEAPRKKRKHEM
jgi:hypothetical protein